MLSHTSVGSVVDGVCKQRRSENVNAVSIEARQHLRLQRLLPSHTISHRKTNVSAFSISSFDLSERQKCNFYIAIFYYDPAPKILGIKNRLEWLCVNLIFKWKSFLKED